MTNEQYTPEGLPVVKEGIIDVYLRDIKRSEIEGAEERLAESILGKLIRDNPLIGNAINRYLYLIDCPRKEGEVFLSGAMMVYELLRRQAESNKLE